MIDILLDVFQEVTGIGKGSPPESGHNSLYRCIECGKTFSFSKGCITCDKEIERRIRELDKKYEEIQGRK
jgi:hypothetical protein